MIISGLLSVYLLPDLWNWLYTNGTAVQALSSVLAVVVGIVTIIVLRITWKAINRQAAAAEEQTKASYALIKAAEEQTKATIETAAAAKEQGRLLALQYEQSLAPLIVARRVFGEPGNGLPMLELKNIGTGVAVDVEVIFYEVEIAATNMIYPSIRFDPSTLGPGETNAIGLPTSSDGFLTIRYRGTDRLERFTVFHIIGTISQKHWVQQGTGFVSLQPATVASNTPGL
ncbi:MAG TPA: hypothetical protein VHX63_00270 [Acidobacteriaceae bacterium]|jgi:hypothetical protein|nr:hypothetical protein [Acidobacteriaceae bacterium]